MSSSGTKIGGRSILVVMAIGIAVVATNRLAPAQLDDTLTTLAADDGVRAPLGARRSARTVEADSGNVNAAALAQGASTSDSASPARPVDDRATHDRAAHDRATHDTALPRDDRHDIDVEGEDLKPEGLSDTPTGGEPELIVDIPNGETVLRLVYFVEADREFDPAAVLAIEQQAAALQRFWFDQFGGTFRLPASGVDVVYGDHPATWYAETTVGANERWNRLANIRAEVQRKLDIPGDSGLVRTLTFPDARIDGRVGANRYEGAWLDGDDISCINGIVETTPYTADYPAGCLATAAHELGHVYGLGHLGSDEDCMQFGFYRYVSGTTLCDFGTENREMVRADPRNSGWLDAFPGDRL